MKDFIRNRVKTTLLENNDNDINISNYKEWLKTNNKQIKINEIEVLYKDILKLNMGNPLAYKQQRNEIIDFINTEINQNECFHNAAKSFEFFNKRGYKVSFILGIMIENGKKFGHAWNKINGRNYDLTADKNETRLENKYFRLVELNDINSITNLSVFDPNYDCKNKFTSNGENYDINGMCSLYPYFMSINQNR